METLATVAVDADVDVPHAYDQAATRGQADSDAD
jgi:hypothetical protein